MLKERILQERILQGRIELNKKTIEELRKWRIED